MKKVFQQAEDFKQLTIQQLETSEPAFLVYESLITFAYDLITNYPMDSRYSHLFNQFQVRFLGSIQEELDSFRDKRKELKNFDPNLPAKDEISLDFLDNYISLVLSKFKEALDSFIGEPLAIKNKTNGSIMQYNGYSIRANPSVKYWYDSLFPAGKDRIIIPINPNLDWAKELPKSIRSILYEDIVLKHIDITLEGVILDILEIIRAYFANIRHNNEEASAIEKMISRGNIYSLIDDFFVKGQYFMQSKKSNGIRIGKILNSCLESHITVNCDLPITMKYYSQLKAPDLRDCCVVISKHPYDLAGMSSRRGWTSCMDITKEHGNMRHFVAMSIAGGSLIAYLCRNNDTYVNIGSERKSKGHKVNISNPLGRVLIKPYFLGGKEMSRKDYKHAGEDFFQEAEERHMIEDTEKNGKPKIFLKCSYSYGTFPSAIVRQVQDWLDEHWNSKIEETGNFTLSHMVYLDSTDPVSVKK